jgi:hypothetical protein
LTFWGTFLGDDAAMCMGSFKIKTVEGFNFVEWSDPFSIGTSITNQRAPVRFTQQNLRERIRKLLAIGVDVSDELVALGELVALEGERHAELHCSELSGLCQHGEYQDLCPRCLAYLSDSGSDNVLVPRRMLEVIRTDLEDARASYDGGFLPNVMRDIDAISELLGKTEVP